MRARFPVVSDDAVIQAEYEESRRLGNSHNLAMIFVFRQAPGAMTDREFLEGHVNGSQFESDPDAGDFYAEEARKAGIDHKGKVYIEGLAGYPGDPRAWVSGRGDVRRICEENGWECSGCVNVKFQDVKPETPAIALAEDLLEKEVSAIVAKSPDQVNEKEVVEIRESLREIRTPYWNK